MLESCPNLHIYAEASLHVHTHKIKTIFKYLKEFFSETTQYVDLGKI